MIYYCKTRVEKWRNIRKEYTEKQYKEIYKKVPFAIRTLMTKYFLFNFGSKKQIETFYEEIAFSYF